MFRAYVDTRSFSFEAYGLSETEARAALLRGLVEHERRLNLAKGWALEVIDDAAFLEIKPGCYRDGQRIAV